MKKYVAAIDQSTSASKVFLVDAKGRIVRRVSLPHRQYYARPGWAEHDALEIWANVEKGIRAVTDGIDHNEIAAIGISNQRETTVLWDGKTGKPLCPAVVWQDVRAEELCRELSPYAGYVHDTTGLLLSPYYPAAKAAHVLRNSRFDADVRVGTMDSWLIYNMSCGKVFATDMSNAGRTGLMDLNALSWDGKLLDIFGLRRDMVAERILPSDSVFCKWEGIPVTGVMGDSHAALYGHGCHGAGDAKATYGTGSSVMLNVGCAPVRSGRGLSSCVAYADKNGVLYALEGNVTCSGDTLVWLCEQLQLFRDADEIERLAGEASGSGGVTLVPAFSGLGAPYFDSRARAVLCGMSRGTGKAQVAYAALASVAQQNADILEMLGGVRVLHADGGAVKNALLMQMQADLTGIEISVSGAEEVSALGCAYMAGIAVGFYTSFESIPRAKACTYRPLISGGERLKRRDEWKTAIRKAMNEED